MLREANTVADALAKHDMGLHAQEAILDILPSFCAIYFLLDRSSTIYCRDMYFFVLLAFAALLGLVYPYFFIGKKEATCQINFFFFEKEFQTNVDLVFNVRDQNSQKFMKFEQLIIEFAKS